MLKKRIIFSLFYDNGFFNQSRNFRLQKVGDIDWLEKNYKFRKIAFSIDELIILNVSRNLKNIITFSKTLERIVDCVFIPIAAGGGISSLEDAKQLFDSGADKLVLNSILFNKPNIVEKIIKKYGSQSVIASIDYKTIEHKNIVFANNGRDKVDFSFTQSINHVQNLGVGEIYLTSINKDGTGFGYDFKTIDLLSNTVKIPLILAGGAGNELHLLEALKKNKIDAVATGNLLNFIGNGLPNARKKILDEKINIARWI